VDDDTVILDTSRVQDASSLEGTDLMDAKRLLNIKQGDYIEFQRCVHLCSVDQW
jgi:hypothetical protein